QLEKIDMLDFADLVAINMFDKRGSLDALRDVRKQWRRNHNAFSLADDEIPVVGTIASQFDDAGMNRLFVSLMERLRARSTSPRLAARPSSGAAEGAAGHRVDPVGIGHGPVIPGDRVRYLAEIAETCEAADREVAEQAAIARRVWRLRGAIEA